MVPIVQPEILMYGVYNIDKSDYVQEKVLAAVYKPLSNNNVLLNLEVTLLQLSITVRGA